MDEVRDEIEQEIDAIIAERGRDLLGIAGGASGGDILFHEALVRRGIPTLVLLALPPGKFAAASVSPEWEARYHALLEQCPFEVLQAEEDDTLWVRNNEWILSRGLEHGAGNTTLFALWDGKSGDGPGGTQDMVEQARARGVRVVLLLSLLQ